MPTSHPIDLPSKFCWSKMGSEAGEDLARIILRKEVERIANRGVFTWGMGTSLGSSIKKLQIEFKTPTVVFTRMKSKAKQIDSSPTSIVLWLTYIDKNGIEKELPEYSLLTSRGITENNNKKHRHYALVCESSKSIRSMSDRYIDASKLRNMVSGKPVGSSQVSAVVRQDNNKCLNSSLYKVEFCANLNTRGQVRLSKYVEISLNSLSDIFKHAETLDIESWKKGCERLKETSLTSGKVVDTMDTYAINNQLTF